jgi:hypothetical protein
MNVNGLRELDEMAAKLQATIHKLPRAKRDVLLRDVERIRAQLTALLSASNTEEKPNRQIELGLKVKK